VPATPTIGRIAIIKTRRASAAMAALSPTVFANLVADKGYHSKEVLQPHAELRIRTYI
jgi:hypothetical protein